MDRPLEGVRVLEIAQFTFVPSAGAVLSDWGADVIKIENPITGDGQRGLVAVLSRAARMSGSSFAPIMEAPNRGKRSVGLGLAVAEARPILEELIRRSDVLLTNYLPTARAKLHIDVDDVRRIDPDIIYVAGSGYGAEGPDQDTGAYDATAFWARGGSAMCVTPAELGSPLTQPGPAYGDTIGGTNIAGGISAALFHRRQGRVSSGGRFLDRFFQSRELAGEIGQTIGAKQALRRGCSGANRDKAVPAAQLSVSGHETLANRQLLA